MAFFPQLVAGPIERADRLIPQLERVETELDATRVTSSLALILGGLTKKVVLADQLAPIVDQAFSGGADHDRCPPWSGRVAFAGQIYGDFSGYTDIARGSSRLLGFELVENFREPYLSRSITEFWRRWHISLSQWLRDYLYIPLGGNRGSRFATARNLMITMLLGGLWHGAAWTFVVWGGLHGFYLLIERLRGHRALATDVVGKAAGHGVDLLAGPPRLGLLPFGRHRQRVGLPRRSHPLGWMGSADRRMGLVRAGHRRPDPATI